MRSHRAGTTRPWTPSYLAIAVPAALFAACAVVVLAGCGGSDKPQYCSDRSTLEESVNDLSNVKVLESGGANELKSQLGKVESDANALGSSVKSDFQSESSAIQSSVSTLKAALQGLPSSPSPQQLASLAADVKAVATSLQNFKKATDSKCS